MSEQPKHTTEVRALDQTPPTEATPMAMIDRALSSGASVEVMERLMALQERWQENEAKKAFDQAIAAAREELPAIVKNRTVDFTTSKGRTHYRYEDLSEMMNAITPVLARHGLSIRWRTDNATPGYVSVATILSHRMGHSEETILTGPYDTSGNKNPIQAIGSVVTYLQRYGAKACLGIAAGHDDDGRQGSGEGEPPAGPPAQGGATDDQLGLIRKIMRSYVITDKERTSIEGRIAKGMSMDKAKEAIDWLQETTKQRKAAEGAEVTEEAGEGEPAGGETAGPESPGGAATAAGEPSPQQPGAGGGKDEAAPPASEAQEDAPAPSDAALDEAQGWSRDEAVEAVLAYERLLTQAGMVPPRAAYGVPEGDLGKKGDPKVAELRIYAARLVDLVADLKAAEDEAAQARQEGLF